MGDDDEFYTSAQSRNSKLLVKRRMDPILSYVCHTSVCNCLYTAQFLIMIGR